MPLEFDNTEQRWFDTDTGQFVENEAVVAEMRLIQAASLVVLQALTNQLYEGEISLEQWEIAVASELKDAHTALSLYAVGGVENVTQEELDRLEDTLDSQYEFLDGFAIAVAAGTVSLAMALTRIAQYGNASQQSYWKEFAANARGLLDWNLNPAEHCPDCIDLASGSPYTAETLPTVPGGGDTRCRANCKCTVTDRGRR